MSRSVAHHGNVTGPGRIFHLITHLRLGAGRAIVDLARAQALAGHAVTVLTAQDAEGHWRSDATLLSELRHHGIRTSSAGDFFHRDPATLGASVTRLQAAVAGPWRRDTVVHAHTAIAGAVARWAGAPRVVVTCHGWNITRPVEFDLQDALALSLADVIVSPSRHWASRLERLPGDLRVAVVPNGFDIERYPPHRREAAPDGAFRIACVGELTRRKGQDVLLQAMPAIWRQVPHAQLHFFGDGDMTGELRSIAGTMPAGADRVIFHGHVHDAYAALAGMDLFCLPSRSDNQPVAIVEAMLAGLPVVSTMVGGIPEMVDEARCGNVVPAESPDALAAAIVSLADAAAREDAGRNGRAHAQSTYDSRRMAARMLALYQGATRTAAPAA